MTLPDIDSNPLFYNEDTQEITAYWTDGKMVYWDFGRVSMDVEHFVWFNSTFAKDSKHCFPPGPQTAECGSRLIHGTQQLLRQGL